MIVEFILVNEPKPTLLTMIEIIEESLKYYMKRYNLNYEYDYEEESCLKTITALLSEDICLADLQAIIDELNIKFAGTQVEINLVLEKPDGGMEHESIPKSELCDRF